METNVLSKWCRICSSEFNTGIFLFGEEARRLFLHAKIRRYLALTISIEDKLPKMICEDCYKKLDGFHRFATMALRNQDKMTKFVCTTTNNNHEQKNLENKSLLHTYLTKGIKEKETQESEITEMEVRVDPMIILQCSLETEDDDEDNQSEEVSDSEDKYRKPYLCPSCPRSFTSELALQNHTWNHSPPIKRILNSHDNWLETEEKETEENDASTNNDDDDNIEEFAISRFSCPICGKEISTKGNLKVHLETHRPKGKYGCDICGRIFKTQCNLYRHKEYHGGIQYPCGVCGRVYPTNSTLRAHSITHSDLRPHKCPLCDKTFKRNQDLKFHINQHTGARPYQCPYCPKAFASSGNCFSHRKRMHPIEVERDRERAAKIMR
ncbi:zinc finger protein 771-like [Tribolium madens]|uniref:zinc finger protein 771-like n=1 Tax=Tribolium madens TaxID=41895 RepID=UPI001CF72B3F|nr:zinc finger protein 771-like [Tribolium madens]